MELVVGASSDAVKSLVGKLGSLLAQEYTLIQGVRDDIQYINDELASMQAFLTRTKRATSHDEQRQDWMKQVREVSYDIEDCVDDINRRLGQEPRGTGFRIYIKKKWYLLTTLYARRSIATEIGILKIRAQQVSERRTRYGVQNLRQKKGTDKTVGADSPTDREAPLPELIGTKPPVGVEDAISDLKGWFEDGEKFLAIFGFGGLGKTTLAMELYRKFGDKFEYRASVQASQKFNLQIILRSLVKQFHQQQAGASLTFLDGIEEWDEIKLKAKLDVQLGKKRYLILIDDIWSVSAWDKINNSLPAGGKVVVTTRFKSVAVACCRQSGQLYEHQPLDKNKTYCLFRQMIPSAPDDPSNDVKVLLEKCGGLPLAIIVISGLVASKLRSGSSSKKTLDEHLKEVAEAWSGGLGTTNLTTEGVTEILDKCYNDLRADLKTCLLYLSMFPKGSFISRKRLIRRWIAEGFIIEKHGKTLQEVAEDYFNELIDRNLIRAVSSSSNGKVKNYQIHDMVLEYIIYKSSDENFITVVGGHWQTPFPSYKVRRLSVHRSVHEEKGTVERMKLSHVRSLSVSGSIKTLHSCLHKFQILQVLDLEGGKDLSFHQVENICEMHQLKYLSLRKTDIEEIPYEIGSLESLEVLDIRETEVTKLPQSVDRLERMTHLLTGNKSKRKALMLTEEITKMTALQTLSGMGICGSSTAGTTRSTGRTVSCKEVLQALEKLTKLKKLSICILGKLKESDHESLLSAIEHLSSCSLKFLAIDDGFTGFLDKSFSVSEAPPEHLQTLELSGMLTEVPKWIDRLHSLEKLTLSLTSFTRENLLVLSKLPELFSLIFTLHTTMSRNPGALRILHKNTLESKWEIIIPPGGFENLKLLRFSAPTLPPLSFAVGAMPVLQRLELKFGSVDGVHGLRNLVSLRQVFLTVSSKAPKAAEEIKLSANRIGKNPPTVVVEEYNESSLEQ